MILIITPQINNEERSDVIVVRCPFATNDDCPKGGLFVCDDVSPKFSGFVKSDSGKRRVLEASYFLQNVDCSCNGKRCMVQFSSIYSACKIETELRRIVFISF